MEVIKSIREKLYAPDFSDLTVVDFSDLAQGCKTCNEFIEKMKDVSETKLNYYGIAICGGLSFPQAEPDGLITEITWKAGRAEVIYKWRDRYYRIKLLIFVCSKVCQELRLLHRNARLWHKQNFVYICGDIYDISIKEVIKMLSIAVCDDEVIECCNMARNIKEIMEEMKIPCIIRQFQSGRELLQALESFDIVFLDIIMQELDGMKTAQLFRKKAFDKILIFVSSSRKYVFEAYDVEAFHYLLKPVDGRKLKSVLQKAILKTERRSQEFIIVSRERQKQKLLLDDIYYFEIRGRIVDVHGSEGIFTYYEQIGELENKLRDKGFFRCHKSYLINLKYVDGYNRQEAILENGEKIVIAKRRYEDFCQEILKVMRKDGGIV